THIEQNGSLASRVTNEGRLAWLRRCLAQPETPPLTVQSLQGEGADYYWSRAAMAHAEAGEFEQAAAAIERVTSSHRRSAARRSLLLTQLRRSGFHSWPLNSSTDLLPADEIGLLLDFARQSVTDHPEVLR